jgi:hypothetical protein
LFKSTQHDTINQPPIYEAKMSLQHAAKHLEKHGRNGDTVLVHMSKGEVKSLNDLAMAGGGQLTINPHTGLPEAGFLQRMLPMVAGAALASTGVGAPMAALMVGGGYYASTGSLKQGLMAGLGAYGGAGMGSALAESGMQTAAVEPGMAATAPPVSTPPPPPSIMTQPPPATPLADLGVPNTMDSVIVKPPAPMTMESLGAKPLTPAPNMLTTPASNAAYESSLANQQAAFQNGTMGQNLNTMGRGISSLGSEAGRSAFMTNLENVPGTFGPKTTMLAAAAPVISGAFEKEKEVETPVDSDPGQQFDYKANPVDPTQPANPYGSENRYFNPEYVKRTTPRFADGGISHLGDYSDGGRLLRGPGDGVSDSIPAMIGKRQPARLADGEFVIPARIVSELGNGSTEAGARKLYAMMDRIQKARKKTVGKGKVAKNSRSEKYLPA